MLVALFCLAALAALVPAGHASAAAGPVYRCSQRSATQLYKRPTYEFSIKLLGRVNVEADEHFVFSPISTWLQLLTIAEGANGKTQNEIWRVTRYHRSYCFKDKLNSIFFKITRDLKHAARRRSMMVVDKLMGVHNGYLNKVYRLYGVKSMEVNFNDPAEAAGEVNKFVNYSTEGRIPDIVYYDDFINTVLLMIDANYFVNTWRSPFNPNFTQMEPFYNAKGVQAGLVNMMTNTDYYFMGDIPRINASVLELQLSNHRFSFLVFLPKPGHVWMNDLLYSMEFTRLSSILKTLRRSGRRLVKVKLPRFNITTRVENLAELINDMGVKRIFNPNLANLRRISKFKMHVSLMSQACNVEVTEKGVTASSKTPLSLINVQKVPEFVANRPFVYMIVDKETEFILYAGTYSHPTLY